MGLCLCVLSYTYLRYVRVYTRFGPWIGTSAPPAAAFSWSITAISLMADIRWKFTCKSRLFIWSEVCWIQPIVLISRKVRTVYYLCIWCLCAWMSMAVRGHACWPGFVHALLSQPDPPPKMIMYQVYTAFTYMISAGFCPYKIKVRSVMTAACMLVCTWVPM